MLRCITRKNVEFLRIAHRFRPSTQTTTLVAALALAGCSAYANAAQCVAHPPPGDNSGLPEALSSLTANLLFEDNFDQQEDFANPSSRFNCGNNSGNGCDSVPQGWTDFSVAERFHPIDLGDSNLQPNLQINGINPRGNSGKSMTTWDESYGNRGQWGSTAILSKRIDGAHTDLYVEMWMKFQPGYRWHLAEEGHGQNLAKILRIGHTENGQYPLSFGPDYFNGPMVFVDSLVWTHRDWNGGNRALLQAQLRCDPQETDYSCPGYAGGNVEGYVRDNASFAETYGDGNWHKIAVRMKLNSSPGVPDGSVMLFFDNRLVAEAHDIPWRANGSPADVTLNRVILGGNMHNYPEPEANRFEQWYAIDDVKIYSFD